MVSFSALLLLLLVPLIAVAYPCSPNVSQALLSSSAGYSSYEVALENSSPHFLTHVVLSPSHNLNAIDGMALTEEGIVFPTDFDGIPPMKTHHWAYSVAGNATVHFKTLSAECSKDTPAHAHEARKNSGHKNPTKAPTRVTAAPSRSTPAPSRVTAAPTKKPTTSGSSAPVAGVCSGTPRMLNGKPCASTTRYWDGNYGACGCGASEAAGAFSWVGTQYTAAASPAIFGGSATWCGSGCGKCYKLTTTGYSPQGRGASAGQSIVVMVTNLCPPGAPNSAWCANGLNSFNYGAHFDLADRNMAGLITSLGWDNPEVTYEEVACTGTNTPTTSEFNTCTCAK